MISDFEMLDFRFPLYSDSTIVVEGGFKPSDIKWPFDLATPGSSCNYIHMFNQVQKAK